MANNVTVVASVSAPTGTFSGRIEWISIGKYLLPRTGNDARIVDPDWSDELNDLFYDLGNLIDRDDSTNIVVPGKIINLQTDPDTVAVGDVRYSGTGIYHYDVDSHVKRIDFGSNDLTITPKAGQKIILDGHWGFDGVNFTAETDANTVFTAHTGKNINIESVTFDGGVVAGASSITSTAFVGALTGNADTASALETSRTIGGVSFDGTANITVSSATSGFTVSGGNLALGANSITMSGSIGVTGTRVTKGWFTDLEVSNAIAGSITGNAATVSTITGLAPDTATTQDTQPSITSLGTLTALDVDNINLNGNTISTTGNLILTATDSAIPVTVGTSAGDDFTINTTGFVYEGDTGNVGIGTDNPIAKLQVRGSEGLPAVSGTTVTGHLALGGLTNNMITMGTNNNSPYQTWIQATNDSDLSIEYSLLLNPNGGNVGIGVVDPDELLELYKVGTQLKLSGGAADYATFAVAADGALTITTVDADAALADINLAPDGNVGINTGTFGTDANNTLGIAIGTPPGSSIAGQIELYAKDSSDGAANATLGLRSEQAVEIIGTFTPSHKLKIWINEVEYYIQLDAV